MKKGQIFEFYCYEADYERFCHVDFDGVSEGEVRTMLSELYQVDPQDIRINQKPLCVAERWEIEDLSIFWRMWNSHKGVNEYEGLPTTVYLKEFTPNEIYRVMLDKKKDELEIVFKNGSSLTLPVESEKVEKQLLLEG